MTNAAGFVPTARPHVAIAADGTLAAVVEPTRITILELPSCSSFAELATDSSTPTEIAWVGTPPRLLVLSRYPGYSHLHLLDPFGPRQLAEMRLESPMRLYASVGSHALAIGATEAATIATTDKALTAYQFPARAIPVAAGAAGAQFVVALSGTIEEWDPQTRMPKRRLKLPRPATITAVGGSDRVVWLTTLQEPSRIEVIPLVNRSQPKAHELPEPIASIASHPRSDVIACLGAQTHRVWMVDLDGRMPARLVAPDGIESAESIGIVLGRATGVLAAQAGHAVTLASLEEGNAGTKTAIAAPGAVAASPFAATPREPGEPPRASRRATTDPVDRSMGSDETMPPPIGPPAGAGAMFGTSSRGAGAALASRAQSTAGTLPAPTTQLTPTPSGGIPPLGAGIPTPPGGAPAPNSREDRRGTSETIPFVVSDDRVALLSEFRERVGKPPPKPADSTVALWSDASPTWRDDIAAWARVVIGGGESASPPASPVGRIAQRHELSSQGAAALALLYGVYLLGHDGAAPVDVARVCGEWGESLGRGELARNGLVTYGDSRVRIGELVRRALDEVQPRMGTLVGTPGAIALLGPCTLVAAGPLSIIAEACLPSIGGAILAGHNDVEPQDLVAEAAAYGAAALWRVRPEQLPRVPADQPVILVADDDMTADLLGVPRLS